MIFNPTALEGAYVIDMERREDERGYLARTFCVDEFAERGLDMQIIQSSTIQTKHRDTLRGLHYQEAPHREIKLVRCTRGSIYLVMVDLRPESATLHQWLGVELDSAANDDAVGVASRITTASSSVAVDVVPVDEELLIAERVRDSLPVAAHADDSVARSAS